MISRFAMPLVVAALSFGAAQAQSLPLGGLTDTVTGITGGGGIVPDVSGVVSGVGNIVAPVTGAAAPPVDTGSGAVAEVPDGDDAAEPGAVTRPFGNSTRGAIRLPPARGTSRFLTLQHIVEDRDWERLVRAGALCLPDARIAGIDGYLADKDQKRVPALLAKHAGQIDALRAHLSRCDGDAALDDGAISRIIGVSILQNGKAVLIAI